MRQRAEKMKKKEGMSYIELIVVLSIFSAMTSIVLFNYGDFQARVDLKNLASDIASKVVLAQKDSLSGQLPPLAQQAQIDSNWKPSYGVYFDASSTASKKIFTYFTDLENPTQNSLYDSSSCPGSGECLESISITKNNSISSLDVFYYGGSSNSLTNLTVTFKRPNSLAVLRSTPAFTGGLTVDYVQITVTSPKGATSKIKIYPSGRIQVN